MKMSLLSIRAPLLAALLLVVAACASTTGGGGGGGTPGCVANATQTCACAPGVTGVQACDAQGTGYTPCNCGGADALAADGGALSDAGGLDVPGAVDAGPGIDSGSPTDGDGASDTGSVADGGGAVDGGPKDSCAGKCGNYSAGASCQCDGLCVNEGDCCSDYAALCANVCDTTCGPCQTCTSGACVADANKNGASCGTSGAVCTNGACQTSSNCGGKLCGFCQKCSAGQCVTDMAKNNSSCENGKYCTNGACVCKTSATVKCVGSDLYNYSSCGVKGSFNKACDYGCSNNKCKPSPCGNIPCTVCNKCNPFSKKCEGDASQTGKVCNGYGLCQETGECGVVGAMPKKGVWTKGVPSNYNKKGCTCAKNAADHVCGADYMARWLAGKDHLYDFEFKRSIAPYFPTKDTSYWVVRTNINPKKGAFCFDINSYPVIKSGVWKKNYPLKIQVPVWPSKAALIAQECGTDYRGIMLVTEGAKAGVKDRFQFELITFNKGCSPAY